MTKTKPFAAFARLTPALAVRAIVRWQMQTGLYAKRRDRGAAHLRKAAAVLALLLVPAFSSAQTRLIDHVPITQAAGTRTFTGNLPDAITSVTLRIARCTTATPTFWASASTSVQFQSSISTDNEATWTEWIGCGGTGGIHVRRDFTEAPEMVCSTSTTLPPRGAVQRRFRAVLIVTGPDLVTEATLEVQ